MIVFRCDASPTLGMGHLMRCRTLASALVEQGEDCVLAGPGRDYKVPADDSLFRDWVAMPFQSPPADDAANLAQLVSARAAKMAVVDDYRADESYQLALRAAGVAWLQFSDGPRRPLWADLALNTSPEAEAADYQACVRNPRTRLLLGPRYAMLRREFTEPAAPLPPRAARRLLLTFGGGDDRGAVLKVLQALLPGLPNDTEFIVLSGAHNPRNAEIAAWIEAHGARQTQLHIGPKEVAPLLSSCSLAVMAGGGTTYEANFFGLPMLLIAIADNQVAHSTAWQNAGAAKYLGRLEAVSAETLVSEAQTALGSPDRHAPAPAPRRLVDGLGRARVARIMLETIAA